MSVRPVPGDPASVSQLAVTVLRLARTLRAALPDPGPDPDPDRPRGTARSHRDEERCHRLVVEGTELLAAELESVGLSLQGHVDEIAEGRRALRLLVERAEEAGFVLVEHGWQRRPGITGTADGGRERDARAAGDALERDLEALTRSAARRRAALVATVEQSRDRLARATRLVRRG